MLFCSNCNSSIFFCTCSSEDMRYTVNPDNNDDSFFDRLFGSNDSDDSDDWSNISSNDE